MRYVLATSYRPGPEITHWAIVLHNDNTHTAYPFDTAGQMHAAIISDTLETMTPDNNGLADLMELEEREYNVFPNDDIMPGTNHPEPFPYLIRHNH